MHKGLFQRHVLCRIRHHNLVCVMVVVLICCAATCTMPPLPIHALKKSMKRNQCDTERKVLHLVRCNVFERQHGMFNECAGRQNQMHQKNVKGCVACEFL